MDTEIYEEKSKNKRSFDIEKIEKIAKPIVRGLLTLILWLIVLALFTAISGIFALSGSPLPGFLFFVPIVLGGILSVVIWNDEIYETVKQKIQREIAANVKGNISEQISEKFRELKPEELQKIREGIAEFKEKFGIDVSLPQEKRKREQIDEAVGNLSDSQLLDLKEGISDGSITEDDLLDWLNQQQEMEQ